MRKGQEHLVLAPSYLQKFECIGSDCEDTCCTGWRVNIDRATYKKYANVRDAALKPLLDSVIRRNRSNASDSHYAYIELDNNDRCPMLSGEGLCGVQAKLGGEYLSAVCATYPRISNFVNGVMEKSMVMSCPEAARLALLDPAGIEFEQATEPNEIRNIIHETLDTNHSAVRNQAGQYLWELRIFTIQVLQNRSYSVSERLLILGLFYQTVQRQIDAGEVHQIPSLISTYASLIADEVMRQNLSKVPSSPTLQMALLKELMDERIGLSGARGRYLQCVLEFLQGVQFTEGARIEEVAKRYRAAYEGYYEPYMKDREYILENYLVNYVFRTVFPIQKDRSLFEDYMVLVIHYALNKMHLIGMAGYHAGLTDELVVKLIQSLAKHLEHNPRVVAHLLAMLKENGYGTIASMAILIQN